MALLDRVRNATRPDNRIEAAPSRASDPRRAGPASPVAAQANGKTGSRGGLAAYATEPEAITRTYYVEQRGDARRFYEDYQRKSLAMRADPAAITSRREDLTTIRAMLTLAEARGWSEIEVAGSVAFRREAWIEAHALGLSAQGYKPSDLDRQEADRRRGERSPHRVRPDAAAGTNKVEPAARSAVQVEAVQRRPASPIPPASPVAAPGRPARTAAVVGRADREPVGNEASRATALPGTAPERNRANGSKSAAIDGGSRRSRSPGEAPSSPSIIQPTSATEHRKAIRAAVGELSPDGKLILAALAEKIDRQMNKLSADAKLETKAFAASELLKKEKRDGPVVLSPELRIVATVPAPAPLRQAEPAAAAVTQLQNAEPQPAQRSRGR